MASRSCIRSAQVAVPVRLVRARVWRVEMATGLPGLRAKPLGKPAYSISQAAGSFIKLPAAWLIEYAGFPKGFALSPGSPVAISTRHTLALTNRTGTATCADLMQLRDAIITKIQTLFAITLEQEPVFLGR